MKVNERNKYSVITNNGKLIEKIRIKQSAYAKYWYPLKRKELKIVLTEDYKNEQKKHKEEQAERKKEISL